MAQAHRSASPAALAPGALTPIVISDGTLEALKWLGIVVMVLDHANRFLYGFQVPGLFELGRLAMPLFAFVLAYNLCRPNALDNGTFKRASVRLLLYGSIATIPFIVIHAPIAYGWWPLNILFTLLLGTLIIWMIELRRPRLMILILPLFSFGGMLTEFWHLGVGCVIAAWYFCKYPRISSLLIWITTLAALVIINKNFYAMLVVPLLFAAQYINLPVPRSRHAFYVLYPAHLAALWLIRALGG